MMQRVGPRLRVARQAVLGVCLTSALLLLAGSCWQQEKDAPVQVAWDRDVGEHCGMIISDRRFAAQVIEPTGQAHKFDDIGCLLAWLEDKPFSASARIWVRDAQGEAWLDARGAHFRHGAVSPMGYGYRAVAEPLAGDLDFAALTHAVQAEERERLLRAGRAASGRASSAGPSLNTTEQAHGPGMDPAGMPERNPAPHSATEASHARR